MESVGNAGGGILHTSPLNTLRVVVCYTGSLGVRAIGLIAGRPDLQLVGVLVHDPAKDGVDAGVLAGIGTLGVSATTALSDVIALAPHCVIWAGKGWQPDEVCVLLEAGINVYVPVGAWYLPGDPDFARVDAACRRGGVTLVGGGSIPGLVSDVLPLFLSGYVGNLRCIRAVQSNLIGDYPSADQLRTGLGFGAPIPPEASVVSDPRDVRWVRYISQSARMVADAVGFAFGSLRLTAKQFVAAPRDVLLPNGLPIPAGTVAGVRWEFTGVTTEGATFYSLTKEQVAVTGLGPTWRESADDPQWRVEIDGTPSLRCELTPVTEDGFGATTAELNSARGVNLIPRIVAAAPGCKSVLDFAAPVGTAAPITVE
jgi:4-hydroxy-tetrahydrodipicolinate reductase